MSLDQKERHAKGGRENLRAQGSEQRIAAWREKAAEIWQEAPNLKATEVADRILKRWPSICSYRTKDGQRTTTPKYIAENIRTIRPKK